jgi:hypothetical protein
VGFAPFTVIETFTSVAIFRKFNRPSSLTERYPSLILVSSTRVALDAGA